EADVLPPKEKEEMDEEPPLKKGRAANKNKKQNKLAHRAPLHERVMGDIFNLLRNGKLRKFWKDSHRDHRDKIALAFVISIVCQEAKESDGIVKRTRSAKLHDFEGLQR